MTTAPSYGTECRQCGDRIIAPEFSEYVYEGTIRHVWRCSRCNYRFETSVVLDMNPPLAPDLVERFFPSLLVS